MKQNVKADRRSENEGKEDEDCDAVGKNPEHHRRQYRHDDAAEMNYEIVAHREAGVGIVSGPIGELREFLEHVQNVSHWKQPDCPPEVQRTKTAKDRLEIHLGFILCGYGRTPGMFKRMRYRPERAQRYSVWPSASPQAMLCACRGVMIVPRCLPSGEITQSPPGADTYRLPF